MRKLVLGIDTGGTHTDAVIFDPATRIVLASAKAETTHHDLSLGIGRALAELGRREWPGGLAAVDRLHLSTTLATNSIAEGLSGRVGLIMIGYDRRQEAVTAMATRLPLTELVFIDGGHDYYGREERPLDEEALRREVAALEPVVQGWAVSGLFSVKNPGHELGAARIIKSLSDKPVTMGRDLTGQLDAVRRAATAALNAGLVVIIRRLLDAVKESAAEAGLGAARLLVVKGDGSLVSEEWARERPIETVVSGPAASLVGARVLAQGLLTPAEKALWTVDVGGTTTDLALIKDGLPEVNPDGARVGDWNTMTVAVENMTTGLGGDSLVRFERDGRVTIGPRRVVPLCRLARDWPQVVKDLQVQQYERIPASQAGCFFLPGLPPEPDMTDDERRIRQALERETPLPLARYLAKSFADGHQFAGLEGLRHPSVQIAAFTPTDAMAILGLYRDGNREAAVLGAELLGLRQKTAPDQIAKMVLDEFARRLAEEIISHAFRRQGLPLDPAEFGPQGLLGAAFGRREAGNMEISVRSLDTVILLGAPVNVLMPFLGRYLHGRIIVPPCFEAASAVGAAASPVYLKRQVEIHSLPGFSGFRLFLPHRLVDGETVDELADIAIREMEAHMRNLALMAGAARPAVTVSRADRRLTLEEDECCLGATLTFTVKDEVIKPDIR